jgi:imidazolonepropionase-like amidohydrolase
LGTTVFTHARIFDGETSPVDELFDVIVADGVIKEVVAAGTAKGDEEVDCGGKTLMPGLIDAHVHVYASSLGGTLFRQRPDTFHAYYATSFLRGCLKRGFTTVRDMAGADAGLALALREGLLSGPRLFFGGQALSQTGGHGDLRTPEERGDTLCACHAGGSGSNLLMTIADGVDAVRVAVREQLRRGAHHIKMMASGGVMSPSDPLERSQYSDAEISVAVEECERRGAYVAAHCHPAESIHRCATLGVRSIEHGTMIDRETASVVAEKGAFVVPTMATCFALLEDGERYGLTPVSRAKLERVTERALTGLEIMAAAGVKMGLGTDVLAEQSTRQSTEFALRARVLTPLAVLRSACAVNAELLGETGRLGCVKVGAHADLILIDGDPLKDIALLEQPERMPVVMKAGSFVRRAA